MKTTRFRLEKVNHENIGELGFIDFTAELMTYITGKKLTTPEAIDRYSFGLADTHFGAYFVKNFTNDHIGLAVIKDKGNEAEIGYLVLPPFTGRGLATEINKELIDYCIKNIPNRIISARVDNRNKASIRILEKCGMKKNGETKENRITILKYRV